MNDWKNSYHYTNKKPKSSGIKDYAYHVRKAAERGQLTEEEAKKALNSFAAKRKHYSKGTDKYYNPGLI